MTDYINPDDPAYLIVSREGVDPATFMLERGGSVFIGSGSNCRLILEDSVAHPIHCMVWMDESKELKVQDWNTGATILNGKSVEAEAEFRTGDVLVIAEYKIIPVLTREFHLGIATELLDPNKGAKPAAAEPVPTYFSEAMPDVPMIDSSASANECEHSIDEIVNEVNMVTIHEHDTCGDGNQEAEPSMAVATPDVVSLDTETDLGAVDPEIDEASSISQSSQVPSESVVESKLTRDIETGDFQYDIDADLKDDPAEVAGNAFSNGFAGSLDNDSFSDLPLDFATDFGDDSEADEEVAMLRLEVEQLRYELVERDSIISALRDAEANESTDVIDDGQTLKLVNRLEELLVELKFSDERVRNLEELLRLSEEATLAEKEERDQLESWVGELEERVDSRGTEYQAEIERLEKRLVQTQEHSSAVENQFKKLLQTRDGNVGAEFSEKSKELIEECRQQITDLRGQLATASAENDQLKSNLEKFAGVDEGVDFHAQVKELQDKLIAQQVESSRERAEMARRHAELERIRDELEERLSNAKTIGKSDSRIKAMREHLREIHAQEQIEKEEVRQSSLSGRIANLLSRLR